MVPQPYEIRVRNRIIALAVFVTICFFIASCIFGGDEEDSQEVSSQREEFSTAEEFSESTPESVPETVYTQASVVEAAIPNDTSVTEIIDSTHIKKQKNTLLAEKIDQMLRRFKPLYGVILVVDIPTNEIIAWGERRDEQIQPQPDYFVKNSFPAASLAKTITIAAAMESKRYSLNSMIPEIGAHHTLYKQQIKVSDNYTGPTIELQDAYAKSANPPLAIVGLNVGAKRLKNAARILGYNMNFPNGIPDPSSYTPPDTGYGLAEASCGFTDATTLTPLLAAAQVRAIVTKKPLEIPWAENLSPFAPNKRLALDVDKFSDNTYYGLRAAMLRSISNGTAKKQISTRNMAKKNFEALDIGGKTGSLDGHDPQGRYEWFMGFAQSKADKNKAIAVVILQIHDLQKDRSQPATQVAALIMNYWAHQNLWEKK